VGGVGTDLEAAVTARFKKESELAVRSKEAAVQPKPSPTAPKSLEELRTAFIHDKKTTFKKDGFPLDPDTITSYEKVTREFLDIIKRTLPGEITRQDLRDWIAKQRERISHRTVCNLYVSIVCFLHFTGVDHKKLLPQSANGTRVPDASLSVHFRSGWACLNVLPAGGRALQRAVTKLKIQLVHALAVSPTFGSSGPTHLFTKTDRTPVQQARGLTILGDLREAVAIWGGWHAVAAAPGGRRGIGDLVTHSRSGTRGQARRGSIVCCPLFRVA
jgi:hypothetical protein